MELLEERLANNLKEKLSYQETARLFKDDFSKEVVFLVYQGLNQEILDPDNVLIQAISKKDKVWLPVISLALRNGANPNSYFLTKNRSKIHIFLYLHEIFANSNEKTLLDTLLILLLESGAQLSSQAIKGKEKSPTVYEYLLQNYSSSIAIKFKDKEFIKKLPEKSKKVLAFYLESEDLLASGEKLSENDYSFYLNSYSFKFKEAVPMLNGEILNENKALKKAFDSRNFWAFKDLLAYGFLPKYLLLNDIIVLLKDYYIKKRLYLYKVLEEIFFEAISYGVKLGKEQRDSLMLLGENFISELKKAYEVPRWKKICSNQNNKEGSKELNSLAQGLSFSNKITLKDLCSNLDEIDSQESNEEFINAFKRRQSLRMSADLSTFRDFEDDKVPEFVCRNRNLLPQDPLDYSDYDIAYFKDEQGAIWCFSRDSFQKLLEEKINPFNNVPLPEAFLEKIKFQLKVLEILDISDKEILVFSEALKELKKKDEVDSKNEEKYLSIFKLSAENKGFNFKDLENLGKEVFQEILDQLNLDYSMELCLLNKNHLLITVGYVFSILRKKKMEEQFWNKLRSKINLGNKPQEVNKPQEDKRRRRR
jgi:hypothetical protein